MSVMFLPMKPEQMSCVCVRVVSVAQTPPVQMVCEWWVVVVVRDTAGRGHHAHARQAGTAEVTEPPRVKDSVVKEVTARVDRVVIACSQRVF